MLVGVRTTAAAAAAAAEEDDDVGEGATTPAHEGEGAATAAARFLRSMTSFTMFESS